MKRIVLLLLAFALLACGCASPAEEKPAYGITDRELLTDKQRELMEKYPQYFGIDATDGLDVIVWQMTEKLLSVKQEAYIKKISEMLFS